MTAKSSPELAKALLAFQHDAPNLAKEGQGNFGKYVTLDGLMERVRPVLNKHGLVLTQLPVAYQDASGNWTPSLTTRITHAESGESIEASMPLLLDKQNSQGLGSALTYARRYAITAFLALVADEDDDGTAASSAAPQRAQSSPPSAPAPAPFSAPAGPATAAQKKKLHALATKLIVEGKINPGQLDMAMIQAAEQSFDVALATDTVSKEVVLDMTRRLERLGQNAEKQEATA